MGNLDNSNIINKWQDCEMDEEDEGQDDPIDKLFSE